LGAAEVRQAHGYGAKREKKRGGKGEKAKRGEKESGSIVCWVSLLSAGFINLVTYGICQGAKAELWPPLRSQARLGNEKDEQVFALFAFFPLPLFALLI
jgi:hypothetical protein